jgi:hypothetical protein
MASDEVQEQAHEGQLNEWRKTDKTFNPEHEITEKQLAKDGEPLGRRLASVSSRDDASKAIEMGLKAFAKTSKATGATPEELIAATSDFVASPENTLRAVSAAKKLDTVQAAAQRKQILSRAQFHGAQQTSMNGVCSYLLGSLADSGLDANFGIKILGEIVASKNSSKKIAEAIASYTEKAKPVAASVDFIKEALADTTEDINVILSKEEIKSNPDIKKLSQMKLSILLLKKPMFVASKY